MQVLTRTITPSGQSIKQVSYDGGRSWFNMNNTVEERIGRISQAAINDCGLTDKVHILAVDHDSQTGHVMFSRKDKKTFQIELTTKIL